MPKLADGLLSNGKGVLPNICLPDAHDAPAELAKLLVDHPVTCAVTLDLSYPVFRVRSALQALAAIHPVSTMPEITIAKNDGARAKEHDVWSSGQVRCIALKPDSQLAKRRSQE